MPTEKTLQQYICKKARDGGMLVFKFASPGHRGVPDLILIAPGGFTFYIEVKNPKGTGRLSKLQQHTIKLMQDWGATVYVIDSKETADAVIAEHLDRSAAARH